MVNLGNVAGVVVSSSPPLEANGVTVKTYVLWAKPVGQAYDIRYYERDQAAWITFGSISQIDDSDNPSLTKTFSKTKILSLLNSSRPSVLVNGNLFTLSKHPINSNPINASVLQTNDYITDGLWDGSELWYAAQFTGPTANEKNVKTNWRIIRRASGLITE